MSTREAALTMIVATGLGCAAAAALGVWLFLTDPVTVTTAVTQGDPSTLAVALVDAAWRAVLALLRLF